MFVTASIDPGLTALASGVLIAAAVCAAVAVRTSRKRWFIGTVIGGALGVIWMISALSVTYETEHLTVTDLYYTYGNCTVQAGDQPPSGFDACGTSRGGTLVTIDHVKTNQSNFEDEGGHFYSRMQVGRTYTCKVETFGGVVSPVIKSCDF